MKTYLLWLLGSACVLVLCCSAADLIIDPFSLLRPAVGTFSSQPNDRVAKAAYLASNCQKYSRYFLGDSRSEILTTDDLDLAGGRFFNYSVPLDGVWGVQNRLSFLLKRHCPLTIAVLNESIDSLHDETGATLLMQESPLVSGETRLSSMSTFFIGWDPLIYWMKTLEIPAIPHWTYYSDGHVDYLIDIPQGEAWSESRCGPRAAMFMDSSSMRKKLAIYTQLAQLAAENHFTLVIWVTPLNRWKEAMFQNPVAADFLVRLHAIPGLTVVEADRSAAVLEDNSAWYECLHFRRRIFDELLAPQIRRALQPT
jgi:hypothetical protein